MFVFVVFSCLCVFVLFTICSKLYLLNNLQFHTTANISLQCDNNLPYHSNYLYCVETQEARIKCVRGGRFSLARNSKTDVVFLQETFYKRCGTNLNKVTKFDTIMVPVTLKV